MIRSIIIEDEPIARRGLEKQVNLIPFVQLAGSFESALDALDFLRETEVDVILSDINMPDLNGMDFLKSLNHRPLFIFITAHRDYAIESYELEVFDFILKPYTFDRLLKSLNRINAFLSRDKSENRGNKGVFKLKENYRNHLIDYDEMMYIQGDKEYIKIVTTEGEFLIVYSLKKILNDLPEQLFIRVHKSFIINKKMVRAVDPDKIIMKNGIKDIPVGITFRKEVIKQLIADF